MCIGRVRESCIIVIPGDEINIILGKFEGRLFVLKNSFNCVFFFSFESTLTSYIFMKMNESSAFYKFYTECAEF